MRVALIEIGGRCCLLVDHRLEHLVGELRLALEIFDLSAHEGEWWVLRRLCITAGCIDGTIRHMMKDRHTAVGGRCGHRHHAVRPTTGARRAQDDMRPTPDC